MVPRHPWERVAENEAGGVDRVDPEVDQGAAAGPRHVEKPAGRPEIEMAAVARGAAYGPELSALDPAAEGPHLVPVTEHMPDEQEPVRRAGSVHHCVGVLLGGRHRLVDEHVLARTQRRDHLRGMQELGVPTTTASTRGILDGGLPVGRPLPAAVCGGEGGGAFRARPGYDNHLSVRRRDAGQRAVR